MKPVCDGHNKHSDLTKVAQERVRDSVLLSCSREKNRATQGMGNNTREKENCVLRGSEWSYPRDSGILLVGPGIYPQVALLTHGQRERWCGARGGVLFGRLS